VTTRQGYARAAWLLAAGCLLAEPSAGAQQLLDRIVARVNGDALTLTDLKAAMALGVIDAPPGPEGDALAVERLIDRQLMLREVARFAPPEPAAADVAREVALMTTRVGARLADVMASTGVDHARLNDIARDTLRIAAYLDQRFGTTVQLTDDEVERYYRIHPDEFTRRGSLLPFVEAAPLARQRAGAERRAAAIAQLIRDLRSRADIQIPRSTGAPATRPTPRPAAPPTR
jgi:hypothetical protein